MKNKIICTVFLLLIFGFTVFDLVTPDRAFSEWENRTLAQSPKLSPSTLFSGEYGADYESYMTDQFAFRDIFVKVKFLADTAVGKTDNGGVYIGEDALYTKQAEFDLDTVGKNISAIDEFAVGTCIDTRVMVVPSSTYIYSDKLPRFAEALDEKEIFSIIDENLENAEFIDITNKLIDSRTDYIYFRTDHHWTADGALIGYNEFLSSIGKDNLTRDDFGISQASTSFVGTLSSKSGALGIKEDTLERFDRGEIKEVSVWNGVESKSLDSMYFEEYLEKKDKYSYYLGPNQPIVKITTDSEGGKLLVFKDSYAHIMAPLMAGDFSEIVFVDLRYIKGRIDILLEKVLGMATDDFDNALFLYSTETFTTQDNMLWIKNIG